VTSPSGDDEGLRGDLEDRALLGDEAGEEVFEAGPSVRCFLRGEELDELADEIDRAGERGGDGTADFAS
jgi:hypothetical protein